MVIFSTDHNHVYRRTARIPVKSCRTFVGRFGDEEYALGSSESGVARAIRRMSEHRREIQEEIG